MATKTPIFAAALADFYQQITPGTRVCAETGESYELSAQALERYKSHQVPPSPFAPWVRIQKLRASASGFDFFQRVLPDGRTVITVYDPESPVVLLPTKEWNEARLNGAFMSHARDYDFQKSFSSQWKEFVRTVPRPALVAGSQNENSEWTCFCADSKNEYYCYSEIACKDTLYSEHSWKAINCCDVTGADNYQWSYETILGQECSQVFWSDYCVGGLDLFFCQSCTSCSDCFGCTNLRQKKFCFLNEQLTEEAYRAKMKEIDLKDANVVEFWWKKVRAEMWTQSPRRASGNRLSEACDGDDMVGCHHTVGTSVAECERCENVYFNVLLKDSIDCTMSSESEWSICSQEMIRDYQNRFCAYTDSCIDIEYCELMKSSEHCFGCIGLDKKQFCIFNKQYTEEEYWPLVDRIKTKMLADGEYGQFFPYDTNVVAYNVSHAQNLFPLTEAEARSKGLRWYDFREESKAVMRPIEELPVHLDAFTDDLLNQVYQCPVSGRPLRFVKDELAFHRRFGIALPRLQPTARRKARMGRLLGLRYYPVTCSRCQAPTKTRIRPEEQKTVLCEACYEQYVANDEGACTIRVSR